MKGLVPLEGFKFGVVFLLLVYSANLHGQEMTVCGEFKSPQDILDCVLQKAPDVQRAEAEVLKKSASEKTAGQRPNPEIETRVLFGTSGDESDVFSEINLFHPLELGGKRSARIKKAETEKSVALADKRETMEQMAIQTVVTLHRLRQIRSELAVLNENLLTYRHVVNLFKGRPLLSPEQETSLGVFELASSESQLKKTDLIDEENRLQAFLKTALGVGIPMTSQLFPRSPADWPEKNIEEKELVENWGRVKKAEAELNSAKATSRIARSEAWPTVRLGPSLETESPLGNTRAAVGFAFFTSLPFYQRNQGGKAEAGKGEMAANLNLELTKKEAVAEKERLILEYNRNLKAFRAAKVQVAIEKKHKEVETLFERGLIPSTLMLEVHRQMFEVKQELHESELKAIEALWRIYALEGRIFEEKI